MQPTSMRSSGDAQALKVLYRQTNGPHWVDAGGWLEGDDPCRWTGVTCESGWVVELRLPRNNLSGRLPAELGLLAHLRHLDLAANHLTGRIPPVLGNLRHLVSLDLSDNDLHGALPARLRLLRHLRVLDLHRNALRGEIPPNLQDLTSLESLDLSHNRFSGEVPPEVGQLAHLVKLSLADNPLSGPLPSTLVRLTALSRFSFSETELLELSDVEFQLWLEGIDDLARTGVLTADVVAPGRLGLAALAGVSTLGVTVGTAWMVLLPLLGPIAGPLVGVLSTLGGTAGAGLVARRVYESSRPATTRVTLPRAHNAGSSEADLRADLIEELRVLVRRARPDLPPDAVRRLDAIETRLLAILPRLSRPGGGERDAYLVRQTIRDYLPEALAHYRALPNDFRVDRAPNDHQTAREELLAQLELLERALVQVEGRLDDADAERLVVHGRFLRDKFGVPPDDAPG